MLRSAKLLLTSVFVLVFSASALANHHGEKKDIVAIASGDSQFSTLVAALKAADLVETLQEMAHLLYSHQPIQHLKNYLKEQLKTF